MTQLLKMNIFYAPDIDKIPFLPEEESQHAVKVLRMKSGEKIHIIDGMGGLYEAEIANLHPRYCEIQIIKKTPEYGKRNHHLHIAIAPTKNIERFEWFLEKATEIGIDEITPIICRFSERKILKTERLQKIILSAAKQSLKTYLPRLNDVCSFEEFITSQQSVIAGLTHNPHRIGINCQEIAGQARNDNKYIAHCHDDEKTLLQNAYQRGDSALILIGPEGDFSKEEVELAIEKGFKPISLGNGRLRTETAGIAACHTINLLNN